MIQFNYKKNNHWRNLIVMILLIIVVTAIISFFLPKNKGKFFHYEEGKPWLYGQLIAKFDFPIFKTEETIKQERDSILNNFQPYYHKQKNIETKNIKAFEDAYKAGIPGLPTYYNNIIIKRFHKIYSVGIMDPQQYNNIAKDTNALIRIVTDKQAVSTPLKNVYSTAAAYEQIFMDPQLSPYRATLQQCNLNDYIEPNLIYDKDRSDAEANDMLSLLPQASGMVLEGQSIIDRGDIIDAKTYRILNSFEQAMEKRNASQKEVLSTIIGQTLYVFILMVLFTFYLNLFRKDYLKKPRTLGLLYATITLFSIITSIMIEHAMLSIYIIPFAMAAIFKRVFTDSRTAFITYVTMILISAAAVKYQYEFIALQLTAGLIAIYSLRELAKRSQIFVTAIVVTLGSGAMYLALQLTQISNFSQLNHSIYLYLIINGIFLLFTYPLMLIIEKTFGFISTVTMFELSNTNNQLLRQLSETAPGTFQHSITVGNLAVEIANKIGAKAQLLRTGALYHDIGKMINPVFFTENQAGVNPHDKLTDLESARIIISHVTYGLKLAEQNRLPAMIKDFISTHHGAGIVKYFYIHYQNEHPDEEVDVTPFRYPGPNPFTREQAILMMSDSVEAASHSLTEYSEESISNLVNRIIDGQVEQGSFNDAPITFLDITTAKSVLIERLKAIYHTRIQYPKLKSEILQSK